LYDRNKSPLKISALVAVGSAFLCNWKGYNYNIIYNSVCSITKQPFLGMGSDKTVTYFQRVTQSVHCVRHEH